MPAKVAFQTRHVMMQRDAVANPESPHARAHAHDGARGLVPENPRRWHRAVLDFLDVGGTHAARGNLYEQIAGADARHRQRFDAQVIRAAIDHGAHCSGNREHPGVLATDVTDEHRFLARYVMLNAWWAVRGRLSIVICHESLKPRLGLGAEN